MLVRSCAKVNCFKKLLICEKQIPFELITKYNIKGTVSLFQVNRTSEATKKNKITKLQSSNGKSFLKLKLFVYLFDKLNALIGLSLAHYKESIKSLADNRNDIKSLADKRNDIKSLADKRNDINTVKRNVKCN